VEKLKSVKKKNLKNYCMLYSSEGLKRFFKKKKNQFSLLIFRVGLGGVEWGS